MTNAYDVGGVSIWRLGGEDPGTWTNIRAQFGSTSPPPEDTVPPSVAITAPLDGAVVAKKITITAVASDNVRESKVECSSNGVLLATDTQAPYAVTWNTRAAPPGWITIAATAYDANGNRATTSVTVYKPR